MRKLAGAFLSGLLAGAAAGAETIALAGATVHPVSGPDLPGGTVLIRDGKIAAVGATVAVPPDAKVVDVKGRHVYPSLFPAITDLGLIEISSVRATVDTTELGEINPQARADFAMNFDSELLPVARSAGILVAGIAPSGGIISGSLAAMKLDGWTREDATLKAPAAIVVRWPDLTIDRSPLARLSVRLQEKRRDEALQKLKDAFADARAYARARGAEGKAGIPRHDLDPKLEALVPAIDGKIPVLVVAQRVKQIRDALTWAKEENIKLVLAGAKDGWRIANEIAAAGVPVIVEQPIELPTRADEPYDANFANAAALTKAGVRVAFTDGSNASNARNLPHQTAAAVAFGFPREKAVAAMTLEPATMLGVADHIGSLEPGKDATLIVTDGDILDLRSRVLAAYLDGRPLDLSDKQKHLYDRYRNRPRPAVP
jgi:imidazolonepropionase-like amidohydrolase